MAYQVRKVSPRDAGRLAEIIVFNNRLNYYPIFQDIEYSFSEFTVENVRREFLEDADFMSGCYVCEDTVVKGFVYALNSEVRKLYVDSFFQGEGIGALLLDFAVRELKADRLWALEKNVRAIRFYQRQGFVLTGEKCLEEGTTEYLVRLRLGEPAGDAFTEEICT